jgi:hypothetical protein
VSISPTHSRKDEKRSGDIVRGGPALDRRRAFDPVERAGYEAAEASA